MRALRVGDQVDEGCRWKTIAAIEEDRLRYTDGSSGCCSVVQRWCDEDIGKIRLIEGHHLDVYPLEVGERLHWDGIEYEITNLSHDEARTSTKTHANAGFFYKANISMEMRMDLESMMKMSSADQNALDDLIKEEKSSFGSLENGKVQPAPVVVICKEDEIKLSDMTDGRLPSSGIDHVFKIYPIGTFSREVRVVSVGHVEYDHSMSLDIPEINYEYYWDPDVLEAIICGYKLNERILLQGYPGTGKTTAIHQFAAWIQQPYTKLGGKDGVDPSSFLGMPWAEDGGMTFKMGMLPQGLIAGYMICIDEIFKLPAGIMMAMQSLLEKDGVLILDDMPGTMSEKTIIPHSAARIFTTDNVLGTGDDISKFAATQLQDTSTLDRIGLTIKVNYLDKKQEYAMLSKRYPSVAGSSINSLLVLADLVRRAYSTDDLALTLSPRGLMVMLSLHDEVNLPLSQAINLSFTNKIADSSERVSIKGFIKTAGIY